MGGKWILEESVRRRRVYFGMMAGWVALTLTLTSIPNPEFGPSFPGADKVAHFGFYAVAGFLCSLWRREIGKEPVAAVLYVALFVSVLGAVDEIHQQWIPGRSMEFLDWLADFAGGSSGALAAVVATAWIPFLLTPKNQLAPRPLSD